MTTRTGTLLTYEVPTELYVSPRELADRGFAEFLPRNNFKSAFIAALKKVYKDRERFYRRFNDNSSSSTVSFACFVENRSDNNIDVSKELVIHVDKKLGYLVVDEADALSQEKKDLLAKIKDAYEKEQTEYNADQFRRIIKNILSSAYAVSIKKGSSVYFLDKRYDIHRDRIQELEKNFPQIRIIAWDMGTDKGAVEAISNAVKEDVLSDMENLIKDFKKELDEGSITTKKVENKVEQANEILEKAKAHAHNIMGEGEAILSRISGLKDIFKSYEEKSEILTSDFLSDLASL